MRRIVDRQQTYIKSENCPEEKIEADQALMADAGLYSRGDGDWVKC